MGLLAALSSPAFAQSFLVQVPATLEISAPIAESVKRECAVESLVGNHVFQAVNERFSGSRQVAGIDKAAKDRSLELTLIAVMGVGGGAWSGAKSMTLRATVYEDGRPVRTSIFRRNSRGGVWGGLSGTCPIMERIAVALGNDIATWLTLPSGVPMPAEPAPADEPEKKSAQ